MIQELLLFARAMAAGAVLLSVYDMLRIVRRVIPHRNWLISLEDGIYWIFNTIFIFCMLYRETGGSVRGYVIFGILTGMLLYSLALSRHIVTALSFVLGKVLSAVRWTAALILRPLGIVGSFLWQNTGKRLVGFLKGKLKLWKNRLKKRRKHFKIKLSKLFQPDIGDEYEDEKTEKKI